MTTEVMTAQRKQDHTGYTCSVEQSDIARYCAKAARNRIPLAACFELTRRCSFRCVHCYLGDQKEIHQHRREELDTERVLALLDEMVKAETLFLHLTGGDPMLRPDFSEIYQQAVRRGLLVTVFCNGTLITDEIIRTFVQYPPRMVEITLYGATPETFEAVTQKPGSFVACMKGIERLQQAKVRLRLKTMVMTLNAEEFQDMRRMAEDRGLQFRHDCSLHAALPNEDNGGKSNIGTDLRDPLQYRLPPEQAASLDMSVEKLAARLTELAQTELPEKRSDKLYQCSAGKSLYYISPYGQMRPCLMTTEVQSSLLGEKGLITSWNGAVKNIIDCTAAAAFPCIHCSDRRLCTVCPKLFSLAGDSEQVETFYCQYAAQRRKKAEGMIQERGNSNE